MDLNKRRKLQKRAFMAQKEVELLKEASIQYKNSYYTDKYIEAEMQLESIMLDLARHNIKISER